MCHGRSCPAVRVAPLYHGGPRPRGLAGRARRSDPRGFTLVEMLVVIAIIVLVTSMSIPLMLPFMRSRRMGQAVEFVMASARRARSRAVTERKEIDLVFNEPAGSISIREHGQTDVLEKPLYMPEGVRLNANWSGGTDTDYADTCFCYFTRTGGVRNDTTNGLGTPNYTVRVLGPDPPGVNWQVRLYPTTGAVRAEQED